VVNTKQGNSLTHDKDFCHLKDFLRGGGREGGRGVQAFFVSSLERFSNATFSLFWGTFSEIN